MHENSGVEVGDLAQGIQPSKRKALGSVLSSGKKRKKEKVDSNARERMDLLTRVRTSRQRVSFSMSFSQMVWPRLKVDHPTSNDLN